jgi:hypothetical protein
MEMIMQTTIQGRQAAKFRKILLLLTLTMALSALLVLAGCSGDDPVAPPTMDPVGILPGKN